MDIADLVPPTRVVMQRALRQPLLHFLLLGGLLYEAMPLLPEMARPEPIEISAPQLAAWQTDWRRQLGRAPDVAEWQAYMQQRVDEEILLREALRRRLDQTDGVTRERLIRNLRFAFPETTDNDSELLAQARLLQMPVRDAVVRRRLVQLMEQRITGQAELTAETLQTYLQRHPQRHLAEGHVSFAQVFFEGRDAEARARVVLDSLPVSDRGAGVGDPFLLGREFTGLSLVQLQQQFGEAFARLAQVAPLGKWQGPVASVYGWHLLRVISRSAASVGAHQQGQSLQMSYAALAEQEQVVLQQALQRLRHRYRVELPAQGLEPVP